MPEKLILPTLTALYESLNNTQGDQNIYGKQVYKVIVRVMQINCVPYKTTVYLSKVYRSKRTFKFATLACKKFIGVRGLLTLLFTESYPGFVSHLTQ